MSALDLPRRPEVGAQLVVVLRLLLLGHRRERLVDHGGDLLAFLADLLEGGNGSTNNGLGLIGLAGDGVEHGDSPFSPIISHVKSVGLVGLEPTTNGL